MSIILSVSKRDEEWRQATKDQIPFDIVVWKIYYSRSRVTFNVTFKIKID